MIILDRAKKNTHKGDVYVRVIKGLVGVGVLILLRSVVPTVALLDALLASRLVGVVVVEVTKTVNICHF